MGHETAAHNTPGGPGRDGCGHLILRSCGWESHLGVYWWAAEAAAAATAAAEAPAVGAWCSGSSRSRSSGSSSGSSSASGKGSVHWQQQMPQQRQRQHRGSGTADIGLAGINDCCNCYEQLPTTNYCGHRM